MLSIRKGQSNLRNLFIFLLAAKSKTIILPFQEDSSVLTAARTANPIAVCKQGCALKCTSCLVPDMADFTAKRSYSNAVISAQKSTNLFHPRRTLQVSLLATRHSDGTLRESAYQ